MPRAVCMVGIDEVGRGSLAGPVVVAAAALPAGFSLGRLTVLPRLKDSKQLSARQRDAWYDYILSRPEISFSIARIYPRGIERMNISGAANLAALRAFKRVLKAKNGERVEVFLDGGLFLGNGRAKRENPYRAKTVIKGDEKIPAIAISSILAKVHRDRFMEKLGERHPSYGFGIHKGYGTKMHKAAIRKYGPSVVHRLTFLGKSNRI